MGVKTPLQETFTQSNNRLIKIYIRFIYKMIRMKKDSKIFLDKFNKVTKPYNNNTFEGKTNAELISIYNNLESEILNDFTTPIANDMGAMVFYGMLTDNMEKHHVNDYEGIISSIMSRQGNVESAKQTTELIEIINTIKKDEILKNKFLNNEININSDEPIVATIKEYILKYGSRCMEELKLETVTMQENPDFLFKTINNYLKIDDTDINYDEKENKTSREKEINKYYGFIGKIYLRRLIKITKYFIKNRESLRLRRTYIYAIVRNIFLRIGKNFTEENIIDNYRDIFYLEKDEIFNLISDENYRKENVSKLINKINLRKADFINNKNKKTYERMYFYGEVCSKNMIPIYSEQEVKILENSNVLKGVAGGGQVVEGIVKYVEEPKDNLDLKGYILMAKRTDPGWTILFPMAKAIIIERGSVLSHSAVVAREMGITLVVGVRGLTDKIKDGSKVRVDGINGTIEILGDNDEK